MYRARHADARGRSRAAAFSAAASDAASSAGRVATTRARAADAGPPRDPAQELRTLHEFLRLATTARTWNELLETVVDGTRDALHADVTSLYLLDRDGLNLRLAGTNGLDRHQIGRAIVPFGEGITGRVAAMRQAMVIADVADDPGSCGSGASTSAGSSHSMLSVPLTWRDQVVGVLNVQTETHRNFTDGDVAQLSAIADLLAGIVEKGRLQAEAEAQVEQLVALDRARSELIALVTHELRTPLAVVRAYTDLLAEEPPLVDRTSRDVKRRQTRAAWHTGTLDQIERLDRLVDSILTSVRVIPDQPPRSRPWTSRRWSASSSASWRRCSRTTGPRCVRSRRLHVLADPARLRQVLEHLLENAVKYAPPDTPVEIGWRIVEGVVHIGIEDHGPGIPPEWRERIFEPYARRETSTRRGGPASGSTRHGGWRNP